MEEGALDWYRSSAIEKLQEKDSLAHSWSQRKDLSKIILFQDWQVIETLTRKGDCICMTWKLWLECLNWEMRHAFWSITAQDWETSYHHNTTLGSVKWALLTLDHQNCKFGCTTGKIVSVDLLLQTKSMHIKEFPNHQNCKFGCTTGNIVSVDLPLQTKSMHIKEFPNFVVINLSMRPWSATKKMANHNVMKLCSVWICH
jgi:hypothetical protein